MTREELREHCERQIQQFERVEKLMAVTPNDWERYEEHKLILELLEQKPTTKNNPPKYCDRNICLRNEYNNVGCEDCEVTKSQEPTTKND